MIEANENEPSRFTGACRSIKALVALKKSKQNNIFEMSEEAACDVPEICRMCLDDISEVEEYFLIAGELQELVYTLTNISIDVEDRKRPLGMCTECFNKVSQFNDTKNTWIENQLRLDNSVIEDETSIKDEEVLHEPDIETQDESFEIADDGEYEYPVEYIDELQFDVDSVTVDEEQEVENEKSSLHKTRKKTKKLSGFKKEKGKVLYQKLLQKCAKCSKMVEKNRMEGHLNKHNDVRPYFCNNEGCGKTFYCKLLLRLHQKSMHTGRSIVCEVCNKTFPSERSLYSHSMRHKNRDRYNCTYCEKKFNNTNSLKRHLAIHSGVREFSCDYCSSSFYRKFNLDVHIKCCHNKDKSYLCNLCPKKFGYSRLLRDHVRRVHGEGAEVQDEEFLMTEVVEI